MWLVMMAAMMLPSLAQMLWRYRQSVVRPHATQLAGLTALAGLAYFVVWGLLGLAIFPLGVALATAEMENAAIARAVPAAAALAVLIAGALQFTSWKTRHLDRCRQAPQHCQVLPADPGTALRTGIRYAVHCSLCCANLTAVLFVVGIMDLRAMALVTAAITAERLAPRGQWIARITGVGLVATGLWMSVVAAGNPFLAR
jgi:predicted metal-binding membrane protein